MSIPIFHMSSFSRSGETLMLRCLQAHPKIEVVHQIREPDTPEDFALFRELQGREEPNIEPSHPALAHRDMRDGHVLILKSAVWIHPHPWRGFILSRNPMSVVKSMRITDNPGNTETQRARLARWARGIDPQLIAHLHAVHNRIGLYALINRKMLADHLSGNPITHYERFVQKPEEVLRKVLAHLGLAWDDRVLRSHENYSEGDVGHGQIRLARDIHNGSQESYRKIPKSLRDEIYMYCAPVMHAYGYRYDGTNMEIRDDFDDRF